MNSFHSSSRTTGLNIHRSTTVQQYHCSSDTLLLHYLTPLTLGWNSPSSHISHFSLCLVASQSAASSELLLNCSQKLLYNFQYINHKQAWLRSLLEGRISLQICFPSMSKAAPQWLASLRHGYQTDGSSGCLNAKHPGGGGREKEQQHLNTYFIWEGAAASCLSSSYHSSAAGQCGVEETPPSHWSRSLLCLRWPVASCLFTKTPISVCFIVVVFFKWHRVPIASVFISSVLCLVFSDGGFRSLKTLVEAEWSWWGNLTSLWSQGCPPPPPPPAVHIEKTPEKSLLQLDCRTTRWFALIPVDLRGLWTQLQVIKERRSSDIGWRSTRVFSPLLDFLIRGWHEKHRNVINRQEWQMTQRA